MSGLRRVLNAAGRAVGLDIRVHRIADRKIGHLSYGRIAPAAEYSPWLDDAEFVAVMDRIEHNTLVERTRCFELWQLVDQVAHVPGDILEVGVWRGGTGALLATRASSKLVYLADTFEGVVKASARDPDYDGGEHADTSIGIVETLLRDLDIGNARLMVGIFPDGFPPFTTPLSFVHIDVDVYDSAKGIMDVVWPLLMPGGIVVFDDYGFATTSGIATLVNTYRGDTDNIVIHNLNGHAILVKTA